jgi:hypothetical protein
LRNILEKIGYLALQRPKVVGERNLDHVPPRDTTRRKIDLGGSWGSAPNSLPDK